MTPDQLRAQVRRRIDKDFGGNQSEAARAWSVGRAYMSLYLMGRRPAGAIATALGYSKVVTTRYVKR